MGEFSTLLQQGNGWFFIPSAILLGILHGLEPGHSKTMMAAFIIAIKGTVKQAVMLGLAATLSHTAIVWLIALGGMYLSRAFTAQSVEPWLQLISAIIILSTACWMFWRTWRGEQQWLAGNHHHHHDHDHDHDHDHHGHIHPEGATSKAYQDAHERAHAADIQRRFDGQTVTNGQILLFGLTGGLIPCPAAITVLLICIQLKAFTLGATMVLSSGINAGDGRRWRGDKRSTGSKALEWFFDACPAGALFFEHSDWSGRRVYGNSWLYRDHAVNM